MKNRILAAAYTILSQDGTAALTTRRVCETVGVTMPTLYHHFPSRDELVQAVYADAMQRFMSKKKELALTEDPLLDVRAGCELVLDFVTRHKNVAIALMGCGLEEPEIFRPGFEHLRAKVARASRAGVLHASPRDAMAMICSVMNGLMLSTVASPGRNAPSAAVRKRVLDAIFLIL